MLKTRKVRRKTQMQQSINSNSKWSKNLIKSIRSSKQGLMQEKRSVRSSCSCQGHQTTPLYWIMDQYLGDSPLCFSVTLHSWRCSDHTNLIKFRWLRKSSYSHIHTWRSKFHQRLILTTVSWMLWNVLDSTSSPQATVLARGTLFGQAS